jgi:hypothetical protein
MAAPGGYDRSYRMCFSGCKNKSLVCSERRSTMSLRTELRNRLLERIFRDPRRPKASQKGGKGFAWSVLVLDSTTLRIVQSCFHKYELTTEHIAHVDSLDDKNRPPTAMHAIYFLSPVIVLIRMLQITFRIIYIWKCFCCRM